MKVEISHSSLSGIWRLPSSKSYTQRALAAAAIAQGASFIKGIGLSGDELVALQIIQDLGGEILEKEKNLIQVVPPSARKASAHINCGESGLSLRMFAVVGLCLADNLSISAEPALKRRPIDFLLTQIHSLGIAVEQHEHPFLHLRGPLIPHDVTLDGAESSQLISGVMLGYAGLGAKDVNLYVKNGSSTPYLQMTYELLKAFGSNIQQITSAHYYFPKHNALLKGVQFQIEADWSNAAMALVAATISSTNLYLSGLNKYSAQGDKIIIEVLNRAGVTIIWNSNTVGLQVEKIQSFHFDATDYPDLFPPLAVLAAHANGTSTINGVHRLKGKESNRALTLQSELAKFGVHISFSQDEMIITPPQNRKNGKIICHTHQDHRIAMACALMALTHPGAVAIEEAQVVAKSYPKFFDDLRKLGAAITFIV